MSQAIEPIRMKTPAHKFDFSAVENILINGDISKMNEDARVSYVRTVCDSLGLNPLTRPFDYLTLSGKTVLYAKKDCTDQLRRVHGISVRITSRQEVGGVFMVTAQAQNADGRQDESIGAVNVQGLRGDALANAMMKAETKAKRRVTLSICGLGLLDDSEIETIPGARKEPMEFKQESQNAPALPIPKSEAHPPGLFAKLMSAAENAEVNRTELQAISKKRYGIDSAKQLTTAQIEDFIEHLGTLGEPSIGTEEALENAASVDPFGEFAQFQSSPVITPVKPIDDDLRMK